MDLLTVVSNEADRNRRKARSRIYPKDDLYVIASIIALISLYHFSSMLYRFITRKRVYDWKKRTGVSLTRLPAAVSDSFRTLAFRWTVPVGSSRELNLAEVGLALAYMAIILISEFVNTTSLTGRKVDPRYYAVRAGRMAASQLPIMVAFGTKNNLISWLTGVSFTRLNYLHRTCARVLCGLIWIHVAGLIIIGLGGPALALVWIQSGIVAGSTLTLLCFLSLRPIRERNYEAFLWLHLVFAFTFVLALYFHLQGQDFGYYGAWPAMIVWGLDRFITFARLATINFGYLNPWASQNSKKELDAVVEVLSPRTVRVTFHRSRHFHWRPGQNVYLSFPSISTLPESHPFTISTIDDSKSGDNTLVFLLRVQRGFTQKLLKKASPDTTYKVFLNGPYGSPPLLIGYQTVILIAGGSGVAFTLPLFLDILRRARTGENACQKIIFVWAIRETEHINWIANNLAPALENIPPSISVAVQLYITGTPTIVIQGLEKVSKDNDSDFMVTPDKEDFEMRSYPTILQSPFVKVLQGRPDLKPLISKEIDEATGRMSIAVCGTHSLANDTRAAIRSPRPMDVLRGGPTVSLHVEAFGRS